ncbi:MAG: hypothetical protein ACE5JU_09815 [Candidatus Binatia bacterium]
MLNIIWEKSNFPTILRWPSLFMPFCQKIAKVSPSFLRITPAIIVVFISALLLFAGPVHSGILTTSENSWEIIQNESDIKIFHRQAKDSYFQEFKGITRIKTSLASLVSLMDDPSAYNSWLYLCEGASVIRRSGNSDLYIYLVYDFSLVTQERDVVVRAYAFRNRDDNSITIHLNDVQLSMIPNLDNVPDFIKKSSTARIKKLNASWKFIMADDGYVEVAYQIHVDPGPNWFTKFMVNAVMRDLTFRTLARMREKVREAKYRNAMPEIVEEIPYRQSVVDRRNKD